MRYSTILKHTRDLGHWTLEASPVNGNVHGDAPAKKRALKAPTVDRDAWYRTNVGARSQSDFWLQMFVRRANEGPP